jgi:1-acyl-sn-glycerol-3-phosphate acyltransferase
MRSVTFPKLGDAVPKRGNVVSAHGARLFFRLSGWRITGTVPNVAKAVAIVAPHTSNWDFLVGVAAMFGLGIRVTFLGKHTLFRWPLGPLMRWLGGVPVDRRVTTGVVDQIVDRFAGADQMILGLAPEGTRSCTARWRTGFYFIALRAGVPIFPVSLDYEDRRVRLGRLFRASGDLDPDLRRLQRFFDGVSGRREQ